jgi:hypothetical protein
MAEKAWSEWYDAVLPNLPGLPAGGPADFFIKRAAIEFFDRSCAYRVAIPAFAATAATPTYTLAAPIANHLVVKVLDLRFEGRRLTPARPEELAELYGTGIDWRDQTADPPIYWTSESPNVVRLVPFPVTTTAGALDGWAAIKPNESATGVEENFYRDHYQAIADMAMAMAMGSPRKPYSNPQEAERLRLKVDASVGFAALRADRGNSRAPMRTKTSWI